jgi:hypothetical protein
MSASVTPVPLYAFIACIRTTLPTVYVTVEKNIENFGGKPEGNRQCVRPRHRGKDDIKIDLTEIGLDRVN